jgi:methylenetetrahydrofolate reductase (NADPH)
MYTGCVPPRMWELNDTSSWINFHLGRDHQSASNEIMDFCRLKGCGDG